jgi:glycosyltransferase involved in cell wall biosynthesis
VANSGSDTRHDVPGHAVKAKRIVQVSSYYPPHLGGQENAVHDLAKQLVNARHYVQVITSTEGEGMRGSRVEKGVHVRRLKGFVFGHAPIMPWFPVALFGAAPQGTVVHLHIGQAFTPEMVWLISKLRGFDYIAQLHIDFEASGPVGVLLPIYKRFVLKRALRSARAVLVLNEKTFHTVRDVYGYKGTLRIVNNGIDEVYFTLNRPAFASIPPDVLRLLFVGRLSKQKNIPTLLKAIKLTKRKVHLDIIGEGDEKELVEKIMHEYGLANVTLHGRLSRVEVMKFYETCDALIMPSLYEAQPLVLLESMAARIPIIGTEVIGVADHIKGVGIVVTPTAKGLVEGLERYFAEYAQLPEMVERGYRQVEKLRWKHTLKEYEALYEEVLGS